MTELARHLRLRPHGDMLLTPSAAFWFFSARVLVFAMAMAEAVAWGYLGFLFGEGWLRITFALFAGGMIFLVVWMIDVSLVTLDLACHEHARAILGQQVSSGRRRKFRELFTFSARVALLLASLTITAPYLAQLVFHKDIERRLAAEATQALDAVRKATSEKYESLVVVKDGEITRGRTAYAREVAGRGESLRYGKGPVAEAMLHTVGKLESERISLLRERNAVLEKFDALARDWRSNRERLAAEYNVVLPQPSILENRKALEALRQQPEHQNTEFAIKAFLAFIFAGLFLLKLFELNSVRLYLSEVLQQEYGRYLAGTFDSLLPPSERSIAGGTGMTPQRLYDFLVKEWVPVRRLEEQQAGARARMVVATSSLEMLDQMRASIENERTATKTEVDRLQAEADDRARSLTELESAIRVAQRDADARRMELETLSPDEDVDVTRQLKYESQASRKLGEASRALREFEEAWPTEKEKCRRAEVALKEAEARLNAKETELAQIEKEVRDVRSAVTTSSGNDARAILAGQN